jgi:broad specificity phosphatase PhoE
VDEPLDSPGVLHARALGRFLARADSALAGPAACARQTAVEAGLDPVVDPELAGWNYGSWAGLTLDEIERRDPDGLRAWRTDPAANPHGGETLEQLLERVRAFLDRMAAIPGRTAAVTDGGVVKAAIVAALGAPVELFWAIDVSPASITELASREEDGGWRLMRSNWTPPVAE